MNDIIAFLVAHWLLTGLFVFVLGLIVILEWRLKRAGGQQLSPQGLVLAINHDSAVIIDLREEAAYQRGHILGAINVPEAAFDQKIHTVLPKREDTPIVLVCQHGVTAPKFLKKFSGRAVRWLGGGMTAWAEAALPLQTNSQ